MQHVSLGSTTADLDDPEQSGFYASDVGACGIVDATNDAPATPGLMRRGTAWLAHTAAAIAKRWG